MRERSQLALALLGLDESRRQPSRSLIGRAIDLGFGAVQLDATAPDLRPRDLDRSARRDLAALLRRSSAVVSGIDLWIPPAHFASTEHQDRALAAVRAAVEFAADLSALGACSATVVSLELPADLPDEAATDLRASASRFHARIADHRPDPAAHGLDLGVDPAAALAAGADPAMLVATAGDRLAAARVSDMASSGRVAPMLGGGRLDGLGYKTALEMAGLRAPLALDLRGLRDGLDRASEIAGAWDRLDG